MSTLLKTRHIGKNISKIREMRGMKQEALAISIGVSQQTISNIENSENVDDDKLKLIAEELGVSVEAIKNFSEEAVINFFNNFSDNDFSNTQIANFGSLGANFTFNPIDKIVQLFEENKNLQASLLQVEKDKVRLLEKLLEEKNK